MLTARLSIFYFCYFALLGLIAPYLGLYLEFKGFGLMEIGQLSSIFMLTKVLAPNVWGAVADHYQNRLFLVRMGALVTLLCFIGFFFAHGFFQFAVVLFAFSFFWNAILPQFEVITLFNLADKRDFYSRIRLWGSLGFIASVVCAGWVFDQFGIAVFPWVLLVVILSIWVASQLSFLEPKESHQESGIGATFWGQLKRPEVRLFFAICFLLQLSHGAYYTYFSIYLELLGYSKFAIGLLWSLGVFAEVLLFVGMHLWFASSSVNRIMLWALGFTVLRWLLIGMLADELIVLVFAQVLHALSFGAMHAAAIKYVHQSFRHQSQGRAQALYSSMGFGAGGAAGAYASGVLVSWYSYQEAFYFSAFVALLALLLTFIKTHLEPVKP